MVLLSINKLGSNVFWSSNGRAHGSQPCSCRFDSYRWHYHVSKQMAKTVIPLFDALRMGLQHKI
ncbi:hypothetical protein C5167_019579 [Papaver somniferum]|uniref:Uncharacterized protein n=1 Tax=Papaver somniferum TaxID=3469 RepID=A0A4Y7IQK0_PAPSO|nr:hypothetical protein C5167_019579 [Papaver somniferum]